MQRKKPAYQVIDGVPRCVFQNPDRLRERLKFRAKKGDLVQVTFPKSGTHWLMYITHLILKEAPLIPTHDEFAKEWRFLDFVDIEHFSPSLPLRTFATHLVLDKRTMTEERKYVYIAHNSWDVCVSLYHMMTSMSAFEFQDGKFEDFAHAFMSGNTGFGDYFEHVAVRYALRK
ncbi:sulfotransferase 1C3-like [Rhipicephalus microplus]|uniref:sulfotransferase 1C3-like n=1 Tax=Rhipicephalus microplus TaxID=6941 RepID=UPI003F6CA837